MGSIETSTFVQQKRGKGHAGHASQDRLAVVGAFHRLQLRAVHALPLILPVRRPLQLPLNRQHRVPLLGSQCRGGSRLLDMNDAGRAQVLTAAPLKSKHGLLFRLVAHVQQQAGKSHGRLAIVLVQNTDVAGRDGIT